MQLYGTYQIWDTFRLRIYYYEMNNIVCKKIYKNNKIIIFLNTDNILNV